MTNEELREKWLSCEYDSIMSNNPGNFVWNTLKDQVRNMTREQLIESVADSLDCTPDELLGD